MQSPWRGEAQKPDAAQPEEESQVQDASGSERLQPKTYGCNARIPEPGRKRWWLLGRCCEQEDTLDSEAYGHDEAEDGC